MTVSEFRAVCMEKFDACSHMTGERARKNIEEHRKGERRLRFVDKNGAPLSGLCVKVNQKTHDFKHGANIFLLDGFGDEERNLKYRDSFAKFFDLATVPFYWDALEPEQNKPHYEKNSPKIYRRPAPDLCIEYCEQMGILPKLHCLFYDKFLPDWLPKDNAEEMWRLYEKRFCEIAERYSGKMYEFEVSNEILVADVWKNCSILSRLDDTPIRMWRMAKELFPNEKLVINDVNCLPYLGFEGREQRYYKFIEKLLAEGAQIDKIGMQHHIFCGVKAPQEKQLPFFRKHYFDPMLTIKGLDTISELGMPLEITEVTIPTFGDDEEAELLQADMLRELYTAWFATPLMENVVYWNTADGMAWVDPLGGSNENNCRGGIFRNDMTPKLAALELKRLFDEEWHTELTLVTDDTGCVTFRGFYGDYTAEIDGNIAKFGIHKNGDIESEILF